MNQWLVTGGVGFIGYHLTRALLAQGDRVVVLDDFSNAPYPEAEKRRNQADLLAEFPHVEIVTGCVTDRAKCAPLFKNVDGVIHLAGLAGVRPSFAAPAHYSRINTEGTAMMFDLANKANIKKILFASSSSVYGNSTPLPAHEESPAIVPNSPYAASKRAAELMTSALCLIAPEMVCTGLRFFTVYGPRQRPEMAITLFMRAVLAEQPIVMFGDGSMQRDFTHVDDIVRGVIAATKRTEPGYRDYNLGSGAPVTLKDLVSKIGIAAGKTPIVKSAPQPIGDVDATFADITRAQKELNWAPQIKLTEGLNTVRNWVSRT